MFAIANTVIMLTALTQMLCTQFIKEIDSVVSSTLFTSYCSETLKILDAFKSQKRQRRSMNDLTAVVGEFIPIVKLRESISVVLCHKAIVSYPAVKFWWRLWPWISTEKNALWILAAKFVREFMNFTAEYFNFPCDCTLLTSRARDVANVKIHTSMRSFESTSESYPKSASFISINC